MPEETARLKYLVRKLTIVLAGPTLSCGLKTVFVSWSWSDSISTSSLRLPLSHFNAVRWTRTDYEYAGNRLPWTHTHTNTHKKTFPTASTEKPSRLVEGHIFSSRRHSGQLKFGGLSALGQYVQQTPIHNRSPLSVSFVYILLWPLSSCRRGCGVVFCFHHPLYLWSRVGCCLTAIVDPTCFQWSCCSAVVKALLLLPAKNLG